VQLAALLAEHEMIRAAGREALEECLRERLAGEGRRGGRSDCRTGSTSMESYANMVAIKIIKNSGSRYGPMMADVSA